MRTLAAISSLAIVTTALFAGSAAAVPVLEDRSVAFNAALHLLPYQNADGSWPWQIAPTRDACGCQNVAGVTALGLLRAYEVSANPAFLASAGRTFDYLAAIHAGTDPATNRLSAPNVFFMLEHALVTRDLADIDVAQAAYERQIARYGGPAALANAVLDARAAQGIPNAGFWDVGLFAQAAASSGHRSDASEMAAVLNLRAGELSTAAEHAALGLAGLVEANARSNIDNFQRAQAHAAKLALLADEDGGFGDVQSTAYAAMAFYAVADVANARAASTWVHGAWDPDTGGWTENGAEYAETTSEAIQALVTAVLPAPSAATSYAYSIAAGASDTLQDPGELPPPPGVSECDGWPVTPATPTGVGPWPGECAPGANLVYAWACVGYGGTVDHFGTSAGFPRPGLATPHPFVVSEFARAAVVDALAGDFDPADVYVAWSLQNGGSGATCSQTEP